MGYIVKLVFGVIDHPYTYVQQQVSKKGKPLKKGKKVTLVQTTGEVAEQLEKRYGLFEYYWTSNQDSIMAKLTESIESACEAIMSGAPPTIDPFGSATSDIEDGFKRALFMNEFDWKIPGVPTIASGRVKGLRWGGINHRLAHPYAWTNPPRPSFIDTSNFESSVKVWVEDDDRNT